MNITRIEYTIIPHNLEGKTFADEYEKRLKEQYAFRGRKEDTQNIIIQAIYHLSLKDEESEVES